jgi:hypothetical protein
MPDRAIISRHIDAMDIRPVDDEQRHRAALNVCSVMHRQGQGLDQIRYLLEAPGLDRQQSVDHTA